MDLRLCLEDGVDVGQSNRVPVRVFQFNFSSLRVNLHAVSHGVYENLNSSIQCVTCAFVTS